LKLGDRQDAPLPGTLREPFHDGERIDKPVTLAKILDRGTEAVEDRVDGPGRGPGGRQVKDKPFHKVSIEVEEALALDLWS
jgi:hypothetical protein